MPRKILSLIAVPILSVLFATPASAGRLNPLAATRGSVKATWACIMWRESRSTFAHPNLRDDSRIGSSGVYQIEVSIWDYWAPKIGIHVPVWRASYHQQSLVAQEIWKHDGFGPWTMSDGCAS